MKLKNYLIISAILVLLSLSAVSASEAVDGLNATSDFNEALVNASNQDKNIVVIFDQDGCYYCSVLKDNILSNPDIQEVLNTKYITVLSDVNKNPEVAVEYKVFGTPTVMLLDNKGKEIQSFEGYDGAAVFLSELK